jgi:hypothetical protein
MIRINLYIAIGALVLLVGSAAAQIDQPVLEFHATMNLTQDLNADDWIPICQAMGYDSGFKASRSGYEIHLGPITSIEQGCLDIPKPGEPPILWTYTQATITTRHGDTLTTYNQGSFNLANPLMPITGTFVVTGGTGRFANARGSGTIGNVMDENNPGFTIYQDGFLRLQRNRH